MNKNILISLGINTAACYAVIYENQVILNSYMALSVIVFVMMCLCAIAANVDVHERNEYLDYLAKKEKLPKATKSIDTVSDIVLLFFLFGFGHLVLGTMWFFIHFIFTFFIKEAIKQHTQEMNKSN